MRYWLPYLPCCTYMTREDRKPLIVSLSENRSLLYLTGPHVNRGLFITEEEYCGFCFVLFFCFEFLSTWEMNCLGLIIIFFCLCPE